MKTQILKQLNKINLDLFYCVTLRTTGNSIDLQGEINPENIAYCIGLGVTEWKTEGKFLTAQIDNITITLT